MRAVVVVLLVAALAMGGCTSHASGGARPSDTHAASSPAPSTGGPSAPSKYWTLPVARSRYLSYVGPTDTLLTQLGTQLHGTDLAALQRVCGRLWARYGKLPRTLLAGRWPAAARPAVVKFVVALKANRPGLLNCWTSETHPDAVSQGRFASSLVVSAANAVRAALGLPTTH